MRWIGIPSNVLVFPLLRHAVQEAECGLRTPGYGKERHLAVVVELRGQLNLQARCDHGDCRPAIARRTVACKDV